MWTQVGAVGPRVPYVLARGGMDRGPAGSLVPLREREAGTAPSRPPKLARRLAAVARGSAAGEADQLHTALIDRLGHWPWTGPVTPVAAVPEDRASGRRRAASARRSWPSESRPASAAPTTGRCSRPGPALRARTSRAGSTASMPSAVPPAGQPAG